MSLQGAWLPLVAAALASACDSRPAMQEVVYSSEPVVLSRRYEDPKEQEQFKQALSRAGISYRLETRDGKEFVAWAPESASAAAAIDVSFFGAELPDGRNFHASGPLQKRFKGWPATNGIPFTIQVSRGKEFIVWDEQYTARVHAWPEFPQQLKK